MLRSYHFLYKVAYRSLVSIFISFNTSFFQFLKYYQEGNNKKKKNVKMNCINVQLENNCGYKQHNARV